MPNRSFRFDWACGGMRAHRWRGSASLKNRAWLEPVTFAVILILSVVAGISRETRARDVHVAAGVITSIERQQPTEGTEPRQTR